MIMLIEIDCLNEPNPGDLPHLVAILDNPASKSKVKIHKLYDITEEELLSKGIV